MNKIITCIDGFVMADAVCQAAIWASKRLGKPLLFLHAIEKEQQHGADDLTGAIGLGARSNLLEQMANLDEQRSKLALQYGKELLDAAAAKAREQGIAEVEQKQRHGDFVEALAELESEARLMVVGRSGEGRKNDFKALGSHIETLIRQVHTPLVIVPKDFAEPTNFMLAYDGRDTADRALARIISGGLLKGLKCHLVMVRNNESAQQEKLDQAKALLQQEGFEVQAELLEGNIYETLMQYKREHSIDMLVMGAFAHSKVRQFFLGSNTMRMLENSQIPLVVLR
ncbi:universal stress protein [Pseudomaricurvus alcaniphilus]|uniref:universal stress protein n=1 Tax=Pseudomaricurvus alcaniphilus TaxID=1166482 RepID=UPI0014072AF9|nr:universal stress protein [Pseudomaricurvus alcaniphilus]NHN38039.1 universal stress protein [Pseudomaricurvus alcaniphilus]